MSPRKVRRVGRPKEPQAARRTAQRRRGIVPHTAILGLILVALVVSSLYPARQLVAKRNREAVLRTQVADLDRQVADLLARRETLQTDDEVERLARAELGMIRPGETAFAVVPAAGHAAAARTATPAKTAAPKAGGGVFDRWWTAFRDSLRLR